VVTRQKDFAAPGCVVVHGLDEAWDAAKGADEVSVIGGTALFRDTLPVADRIHLTEVQAKVDGDTFFPAFDRSQWRETEVSRHAADARHSYPFRIVVLDRRR
jgi:dihydrofolate reductase